MNILYEGRQSLLKHLPNIHVGAEDPFYLSATLTISEEIDLEKVSRCIEKHFKRCKKFQCKHLIFWSYTPNIATWNGSAKHHWCSPVDTAMAWHLLHWRCSPNALPMWKLHWWHNNFTSLMLSQASWDIGAMFGGTLKHPWCVVKISVRCHRNIANVLVTKYFNEASWIHQGELNSQLEMMCEQEKKTKKGSFLQMAMFVQALRN